jgi:SagB-type dehydrogenase family enzyme
MTMRLMMLMTIVASLFAGGCMGPLFKPERPAQNDIVLPPPSPMGGMSLTEALAMRRSVRAFAGKAVTMEQISQLCWAAQGITDQSGGKRTAPSAMALYACTIYVVNKDGSFEYLPAPHALRPMGGSEAIGSLRMACWQPSVGSAPMTIVLAVNVDRFKGRSDKQDAEQYSLLEAGHVAQNVLLQATALGLASVPVGGADEAAVAKALGIPAPQRPVYLLPVGYKK